MPKKRFTSAQIAYLSHYEIARYGKKAYFAGGSEDLRALLPALHLSKTGDEAFILINPQSNSMALYIRVIAGNKIVAFISDSQGLQWAYYPTRDIANALEEYFKNNVQIILSNTPLRSQTTDASEVISIETLAFCAKEGDVVSQEIAQLDMSLCQEAHGLPVYILAENAIAPSLRKALESRFRALSKNKVKQIWQEKNVNTLNEQVIDLALQNYEEKAKEITIDQQSHDYLIHLSEWCGLTTDQLLPEITGEPIYQWTLEKGNRLKIRFKEDQFNDGQGFFWTPTDVDNLDNVSSIKHILAYDKDIKVKENNRSEDKTPDKNIIFEINKDEYTITVSAANSNILRAVFDHLLLPQTQWQLFKEGYTQLFALHRLAHESKEALEIEAIQQLGLGIDTVNLALNNFLAHRHDIVVLEPHLLAEPELLASTLKDKKDRGVHYAAFSFAVNSAHQVLVIIDNESGIIKQIDSLQLHDLKSIETLLKKHFPTYEFVNEVPVYKQKVRDNYSCGWHVVQNALTLFNEPTLQSGSNRIADLRIILRAAQHQEYLNHEQIVQKTKNETYQRLLESEYVSSQKERLEKMLDAKSPQLKRLSACITYLPHLIQDEKDLKIAFANLEKLVNDIKPMAKSNEDEEETKLLGAIGSEIQLLCDNEISVHAGRKLVESMFVDYLIYGKAPDFLAEYIQYYKAFQANVCFYYLYLLVDRLVIYQEQSTNKQKSLQTALTDKKTREENRLRELDNYVTEIISGAGKGAEIFETVIQSIKHQIHLFTKKNWISLLKRLPKDPILLQKILTSVLELVEKEKQLGEESYSDERLLSAYQLMMIALLNFQLYDIAIDLYDESDFKPSEPTNRSNNQPLLSIIPDEEKTDIVCCYLNYIKNNLLSLKQNSTILDYANAQQTDTAKKYFEMLIMIRSYLDERYSLFFGEKTDEITDCVMLQQALILLSPFDPKLTIDLLRKTDNKITNGKELGIIASSLKLASDKFIKDHHRIIKNLDDLIELLANFQADGYTQITFIEYFADKIESTDDLIKLLTGFNAHDDCQNDAIRFFSDKIEGIDNLIKLLTIVKTDRERFMERNVKYITNGDDLKKFIAHLVKINDSNLLHYLLEQTNFKRLFDYHIEDDQVFLDILQILPTDLRTDLTLKYGKYFCSNVEDLLTCFEEDDRFAIAIALINRSEFGDYLCRFAKQLSQAHSVQFIKEKLLVHNDKAFIDVLPHFNDAERVMLIKHFDRSFYNVAPMITTAKLLPETNRDDFILRNKYAVKIKEGDLVMLLAALSKDKHQFLFDMTVKNTKDVHQLYQVLEILNPSLRFQLVKQLIDLIKTKEEVTKVGEYLASEELEPFSLLLSTKALIIQKTRAVMAPNTSANDNDNSLSNKKNPD